MASDGGGAPATGLRIALLGLGRYSGGGPIPLHLARALAADHVVRSFVDAGSLVIDQWRASGLDVYEQPGVYRTTRQAALSLAWSPSRRSLAAAIRRFAPDVLLVPFIHLWARSLANAVGVPMVLCVHDPTPHPGLAGALWHVVERMTVRRSAHIVLHSDAFVPDLMRRYGVRREAITVAPLGPMTDYVDDDPAEPSTAPDPAAPRVLCFGRIEPYKGIDVLFDAVPLVRAEFPAARFTVAGRGASDSQRTRARALGVECDDRWIDDAEIPRFFRAADVVVLPYVSATQSGVIPIAAAFARPVVASDVGGLAEQLGGGHLGLVVPPGDPHALASALLRLLRDPALSTRLGGMLRAHYDTERSWSRAAREIGRACQRGIEASPGAVSIRR